MINLCQETSPVGIFPVGVFLSLFFFHLDPSTLPLMSPIATVVVFAPADPP